ncbi:MAG: hypothetical protein IKS17_02330 [Firmicutes bacterium]|nr:hypothetical protein [Bacillota bacterium]
MGKYGSGMTLGSVCNLEKAEIKRAFAEKDPNVENIVLAAYDEVVCQALKLAASGRAMERLFEDKGGRPTTEFFGDYVRYMAEEETKYNDYIYEENDVI